LCCRCVEVEAIGKGLIGIHEFDLEIFHAAGSGLCWARSNGDPAMAALVVGVGLQLLEVNFRVKGTGPDHTVGGDERRCPAEAIGLVCCGGGSHDKRCGG